MNILCNSNIYKRKIWTIFFRLLVLLFVYTLLRIIFCIANTSHFPDIQLIYFLGGMRFDIAAIAILNAPFILALALPLNITNKKGYSIICNFYFVIVNSIGILLQCVDIAYFPYVFKRLSADIFTYISSANFDISALLPLFIKQFWYLLILFIACIFLLIWTNICCRKFLIHSKQNNIENKTQNITKQILIFLTIILLSITAIRGGWQLRPIQIVNACSYATPQYLPLVLNTPFSIISTLGNKTTEKYMYFNNLEEAEKYFSPIQNNFSTTNIQPQTTKNVIIIVLEGISQELMKFYQNNNLKCCSFLDSLAYKSLAFNGIANGKRTMEGIPAIVCGMPSLMSSAYIETPFAMNKIQYPVEILKNQGFNTYFFHGGENGTMNFESFCHSIGYQHYFGKNEYPEATDYDGHWGISDWSYLRYVAQTLDTIHQPFFSTILTLSSHHPFEIPQDAPRKSYPQGPHKMYAVSSYTDDALAEFFRIISQKSWYDSTLFIITADHAYEGSSSATQNAYTAYQIPMLFFHPKADSAIFFPQFMQQTDIMPSLFAYLGINQHFICFGHNIFDNKYTPKAFNYLSNIYQIYINNHLLQFDGKNIVSWYNVQEDKLLQNRLPIDTQADSALIILKALLQSYSNRLIDNNLNIRQNQ